MSHPIPLSFSSDGDEWTVVAMLLLRAWEGGGVPGAPMMHAFCSYSGDSKVKAEEYIEFGT